MTISGDSVWPLPARAEIRGVLRAEEHEALVDWVIDREDLFREARVVSDGPEQETLIKPETRVALTTSELGPYREIFEQRFWDLLPALERSTGCKTHAECIELDLAAHGDGAHYRAHVDVSQGKDRKPLGAKPGMDRVLSAVYYFHREPKGFSGGQLRLFRFGSCPHDGQMSDDDWIDIQPTQNSLVAFPSWTLHEVRPVTCPSREFRDYRFAINCWFCRALKSSQGRVC